MVKSSDFNLTAYRIIRLAQWLRESPLSLEEIHTLFKADERIGKALSQDSLGIYMNTLRALGCDIDRPKPSNGHRYVMHGHSFSYHLAPEYLRLLANLLYDSHHGLNYRELLQFYSWLKKVFEFSNNPNRHELADEFFSHLRLTDFLSLEPIIDELEQAINNKQLLTIYHQAHNDAPTKEKAFLPEKLFHINGAFYIQGHNPDYESGLILRLDRITKIDLLTDPLLRDKLLRQQLNVGSIRVRLLHCQASQCHLTYWAEHYQPDPKTPDHVLMTFRTDNWFLLKQQLLESGYAVQILSPQNLRDDLIESLHHIKECYAV